MEIRYCQFCRTNVPAKTGFNPVVFTLLFLFCLFPGIIYYLKYGMAKGSICPHCGNSKMMPARDFDEKQA